ncbi:hypothetical protein F4808DRAFT_410698 [Astrocystis sublimbata]|nr:hypothetical protein F4808DRAFT_410698 [Astrocystis sublimbata]
MSPQDKAKNTNGAEPGELPLTPPELKLFSIIVKHLPKSFEVDWDKVAADAGMKSGDVAKVCLSPIPTHTIPLSLLGVLGSLAHSYISLPDSSSTDPYQVRNLRTRRRSRRQRQCWQGRCL